MCYFYNPGDKHVLRIIHYLYWDKLEVRKSP